MFWLNLGSKAEVDKLFAEGKTAQAKIVAEPEDKTVEAARVYGRRRRWNLIRAFYDFRWDPEENHASH